MDKNSTTTDVADRMAIAEEKFILESLKKRGLNLSILRSFPRQTATETIQQISSKFLRTLSNTEDNTK
jgi:hypothetical protein